MAILLLTVTSAAAQGDDKYSRRSLMGLKGVYVLVTILPAEAEAGGLNRSAIQTDVELKLRQAGIKVLTETEATAVPGAPSLYVEATLPGGKGTTTTGLYACSLNVRLEQIVRLERDPITGILAATTWSAPGIVGMVGQENLRMLRDTIKDMVDQFINAWLSVNPK
jgi:hypothetical protein